MRKLFIFSLLLISAFAGAQPALQSPAEFLGYELGDRFTRHHRVVEYFKHVDDAMPNVKLMQYGETYEHRPLVYAIIASPENFANLEQIRTDNLKRAGAMEGTPSGNKVAIVWLSYNVHGNEANSMEASMKTLYELVNPANAKTKEWLKNTVIIMDPCINPDGRDRYANFYNQYGNNPPNPDVQTREHREPWPGGRANHYLFDLNRDWAWQTQIETQNRIKIYSQWLPHIHVDYHEQSYNSPYYFAPAAEPLHDVISSWQREFQTTIGRNNAKYFDEKGWLYFTKERFDLYYPSYGDTYPTYNGAIGMTYEKAGGGAGGLVVTTREGDPLTLKDRLTHHHTTGMSTIEVSSQNATRLVDEFEKYFEENMNLNVPYKTYVIKGDNNPDKLKKFTAWMTSQNIQFGHAAARPARGFDYQTQAVGAFNLTAEDIVVNVAQPKGRFITTVMEPQSKLNDSLTYDVTAWNLIYSYSLKAFAVNEKIAVTKAYDAKPITNETITTKPYAYIFRYQSLKDVEFLAALMKKDVKVRSSRNSFTLAGQTFDPGTLVVTRKNNEGIADFDNLVQSTAKTFERKIFTATTGFVDKGQDFGSSDVSYLRAPKIAVLGGDQTSSLNHGEIWHFFEQQIHYPINVIGTDQIRNIDLWKYNVLVVPDGNYRLFDESLMETINRWIGDGNKLILLANSTTAFADKKGFGLKVYANDDAKNKAEKAAKEQKEKEGPVKYGEAERKELSNSIFGAIYKVTLDKTHPLAFGLGDYYYSLRTNELRYSYLDNGWSVGIIKGKQKPLIGFAGYKINQKLENSLVFGVEDKGRGQVVYMVDNPVFRAFWENGKMIFSNAVFMVGQ